MLLRKTTLSLLCLLWASCCLFEFASSLKCVGDDGSAVDWWVVLKSPKRRNVKDPNVASGMGYAYLDSERPAKTFTLNKKGLDDPKSPLVATLSQIYSKKGVGHVMYNDDPPGKNASSYYAHAKGVFGFDKGGGFWLVHSMPEFPASPPSKLEVPDSQVIYGQSFFCLSLSVAQMNKVGGNLNTYNAQFYSYSFPSPYDNLYTALAETANRTWKIDEVTSLVNFTISGMSFAHFAKNAKWGGDLYSEWVSLNYRTGLLVETWMRPHEDSIYPPDSKYEVVNVNEMKFGGTTDDYLWEESSDHSKWTISTLPSRGLFCIGDINKQKSQQKRGGGTVCASNCNVYAAFSSLILSTDKYTAPSGKDKVCQ